jgi:tetratricopeptide (TPR) repeat protein
VSHGLRLQSVLVHHRLHIADKILLCEQSVAYARLADDTNTLVSSLIELATAYKYNGQLDKWLITLQEALYHSMHATPLVQSPTYFKSALAFAYHKRKREADLYLEMALDVLPTHPERDPEYALADTSFATLSRDAGRAWLEIGQVSKAYRAFDLYKQYPSSGSIPERVRLEIVNGQSKAAIEENDLEKYAYFLEDGIIGAVTLGSKKRFSEIYATFQEDMPATWMNQGEVARIAAQYHLKRARG